MKILNVVVFKLALRSTNLTARTFFGVMEEILAG